MRQASFSDIPQLVELMREFYAESDFALNEAHAAAAFSALLADERLGAIWLLDVAEKPAGYLVLTWCYSMEYGGQKAVLDDFFVRPAHRNTGVGTAALAAVPDLCRARGMRAITIEAAPDNGPAQRVYRRTGFVPAPDRELLTLALAAPSHDL